MGFITDIKDSVAAYTQVMPFVRHHKVRGLLFISFLLYIIVFAMSAFLLWYLINYTMSSLLSIDTIQKYTSWLSNYKWLLILTKAAIYIACSFLLISIFKFIFLVIASPLYAYISERTAELLIGKEFPFKLSQFFHDILRGLRISTRNFLVQMFFTIPLFLLSFIPIIGLFFSFILILLDSYYYGFSMLDYNCERHKINMKQSIYLIGKRKGLAIGNGIIVYISLLIPIIGVVIIAPFSAIAATLTFYKYLQQAK